jgi:hypothetical protein
MLRNLIHTVLNAAAESVNVVSEREHPPPPHHTHTHTLTRINAHPESVTKASTDI